MNASIRRLLASRSEAWLRRPAFWALICAAAPSLLLCLPLGGIPCLMLGIGYVQLVFAALFSGEMVETNPLQRAAALCSGTARMLFFTGMTVHAAWPFGMTGAMLLLTLLVFSRGERERIEMSPLPLLSAVAFTALGFGFSIPVPAAQLPAGALIVTAGFLLVRRRLLAGQLRMRFHWA